MQWQCPACRSTIVPDPADVRPRPQVVYRCYVCRLELLFNEETNQMELAPIPPPPDPDRDITKS